MSDEEHYMSIPVSEFEALHEKLDRARLIARTLFAMVPRQAWLDSGGDDGQGHYEGDYRAATLQKKIATWDQE